MADQLRSGGLWKDDGSILFLEISFSFNSSVFLLYSSHHIYDFTIVSISSSPQGVSEVLEEQVFDVK